VNITSLSGGRKLTILPTDVPVQRLVICNGEILNTPSLQYNSRKIQNRVNILNFYIAVKIQ